jgi:hypothetical protein
MTGFHGSLSAHTSNKDFAADVCAINSGTFSTNNNPSRRLPGNNEREVRWTKFQEERKWLEKILENAGATIAGAGLGMGAADVQIELEGYLFNVNIRPIEG